MKIRHLSKLLLDGLMGAHNHLLFISAYNFPRMYQILYIWKMRTSMTRPWALYPYTARIQLFWKQQWSKILCGYQNHLEHLWKHSPHSVSLKSRYRAPSQLLSKLMLRQLVPRSQLDDQDKWQLCTHHLPTSNHWPPSQQKQWRHKSSKSLTLKQSLGFQNHFKYKISNPRSK